MSLWEVPLKPSIVELITNGTLSIWEEESHIKDTLCPTMQERMVNQMLQTSGEERNLVNDGIESLNSIAMLLSTQDCTITRCGSTLSWDLGMKSLPSSPVAV